LTLEGRKNKRLAELLGRGRTRKGEGQAIYIIATIVYTSPER
jgi:hypothetical protein